MDQKDASKNMDHLKSKAKDMVAVLLNVFAQLPRESRGMVGEVIGIWTGIMGDAVSLSLFFQLASSYLLLPSNFLSSPLCPKTPVNSLLAFPNCVSVRRQLTNRISKKHTKA